MGHIYLGGLITKVAVSGNFAYVAVYWNNAATVGGLAIVDISDPNSPIEMGFLHSDIWNGVANGIAISPGYAYIATYNVGLRIVNVADPTNPQEIGSYTQPPDVLSVAVKDNLAFLGTYYEGLRIVDVTDHTNPVLAGFAATPSPAYDVLRIPRLCLYCG